MNAPNLLQYLSMKLEQKRMEHPSFRLMVIEDNLFPKGMITVETEAQNSDNELKTVKEIVAESWERESKNHLMIEGEGGIGKTVTLLSIPEKFAPFPVPAIYIPLHELTKKEDPIEHYIKRWILNNNEDLYGQLLNLIDRIWDKGPQLMLLLDGFNEIAAENRKFISEDIGRWSEYPGIQIVTSSRYDIHTYVALNYDYSTIKLQPLSDRTVEEYLNSVGIPIPVDSAVKKLITIPLLLTLYLKTELVLRQRETLSSNFREVKNAGSLIWNYLQCELWRFGRDDKGTKNAIIAMEFIAPYIAWEMHQKSLFLLNKEQFNKLLEEAYKLLDSHFNKQNNFPFHIQDALQRSNGIPSIQLIRELLVMQLCLFESNGSQSYRLINQEFRDALAAMHLINMRYLSNGNLPQEWNFPIEHNVLQYVVDLISEEEATRLWEQNRKTAPAIDNATRNQLQLQGLLCNNDFSHLDFSGLDLSNISLYPYRFNKTTIKLPTLPIRIVKTKLSEKTFIAEGPKDWVDSIAVTPNGKQVISGSRDGIISIWDLETGDLVRTLEEHHNWVRAVTISPDGKYVISGSNDCTICFWKLETGKLINTLKGHMHWVSAVAVTPDGKRIVSGSFDNTIRIWDMETGKNIMTLLGHEKGINAIAITPDGKRVISGSNDCTIRIWDLETGCLFGKPIEGHEDWVNTVVVTPNGKRIISGSFDNTIRVWDLESGRQIGKPIEGHKDSVNAVTITPDCKRIVSGSDDKTIRIWDLETGEPIGKPIEGHKDSVNAVAVTPDGQCIISGSGDSIIRVWDMETGAPTRIFNEGLENSVNAVVVSPDGKRIVCGLWDNTIRMWDMETGTAIGRPIEGHEKSVYAVEVTQDGKLIVCGSDGHTIRVWDMETGAAIGRPIEGHKDLVTAVAVTPDGKRIICGSADRTIRVWDIETGAAIGEPIEGQKNQVTAVAVTPDGKHIVSGSADGTIHVWDMENGAAIGKPIEGHILSVTSVAVTPNGKRIVSGSADRTTRVWDMERGVAIGWPIEGHKNIVTAVAVTPDEEYIVSGSADGTICITNMKTREVKKIKVHPLSFVGLDFSLAEISDAELKETLRQNGAKVDPD